MKNSNENNISKKIPTDLIKQYWFIGLIAFILIALTIVYSVKTYKPPLKGLKKDGHDIVAVLDTKEISADDLYANLSEENLIRIVANRFKHDLINESIETTGDLKDKAKELKEHIIRQFRQNDEKGYEKKLAQQLAAFGYEGKNALYEYALDTKKTEKAFEIYIEKHIDKFLEKMPKHRQVSHILIAKKDNNNDEAKMKELMAKVDDELKTKSFEDVAKEYSNDPSKEKGGSLGIVDTSTQFVKEFLDAALALNEKEVSGWVETQFGFHKIKVGATTKESFLADDKLKEELLVSISQKFSKEIFGDVFTQLWNDSKVEFTDKDLEAKVKKALGVKE